MPKSCRFAAFMCVFSPVICWIVPVGGAIAQAPRSLVVVTDASDEDSVKRIGDKLVSVAVLVAKEAGEATENYRRCNVRVRELRDFQFLLYREDTECTTDRFWRQRLTAANPDGTILRLPKSRPRPEIESRAERAKVIHKALSSKFPNKRNQLDANLQSELKRLYSCRTTNPHLAMND